MPALKAYGRRLNRSPLRLFSAACADPRLAVLEARAWHRAWTKYPRKDCSISQAQREAMVEADPRVIRWCFNHR